MKLLIPFLRVLFFAIIAFFLFEVIAGTDDQLAFEKYPLVQTVFWGLVILAVFIEVVVGALKSRVYNSLNEEAQERFEAFENDGYFGKLYTKMLDSKPMEEEGEIILDHNYDGIKELDNTLPPWWVYMFYATIFFAVFYLVKYEVLDGDSNVIEYEKEVAQAEINIAEYNKNNPETIDASSVVLLTEAKDLDAGKEIFTTNCAVCHKADGGGGIGPNLTDENWILGGGIKNVFTTISEGGRPSKGMVPWNKDLTPNEIAQVGSYLLEFQGTTPAAPKAAEGDVWEDPDADSEKVEETSTETEDVEEIEVSED